MKKIGRKNIIKTVGRVAGTLLLVGTLTAFFCAVGFVFYAKNAPDLRVDEFYAMARAQDKTTRLYCVSCGDGKSSVIRETEELFAEQNRDWVKYGELPENLINAFVAIEDHTYFSHKGVSPRRTLGAVIGFLGGKGSYGGSTITQQLIKNVTGDDGYSVSRKIREIIKAYKLDKVLSKEEILELYLNTIFLSEKCYGVGTAAKTYFGKDVSELSLSECAALAAIPQSPTKWNPRSNPELNKTRRKTVLFRMAELGMISESEAEEASERELKISEKHSVSREGERIYSWYTEAVIEESIRLLMEKGLASNRQTATKLLYTGGLQIVTAVCPEMQERVEEYFKKSVNFYPSEKDGEESPECSMVVMDKKGNILALAGAIGEKKSNRGLSFATGTLRSPGSVIKPLAVYAPGIEKGIITYGSVIDDTPVKFVESGGGMRGWPQNYPTGYRGLTTVRDAVARSVNTVSVKTLESLGVEESFKLLHDGMKMRHLVEKEVKNGKTYTDKAVCPLALGQLTSGVSVSEITAGYTAFLDGGVFHEAKTVLKILDSEGRLLINNQGAGERLFSPETACIMTKLLQGVTASGTASVMKLKERVECAGKTGTTGGDSDRWFIGYTPDLIAGVWFGYPEPKELKGFPTLPSPALKTWDRVMQTLCTEECLGAPPKKTFPVTEGVITATYCRDSGKLMTAACACDPRGSRAETGYFTRETAPQEYCNCHLLVEYDTVHGGIACPFCPFENRRRVGLLNVVRELPYDVLITDAQYTYRVLTEDTPPCLISSKPFYLFMLPEGTFPGHSAAILPFNRYCFECYFSERLEDEEYSEFEE